jgi:SAM-dependent methyltransferase
MMVIGQEFGSNPRFRRVLHIAPERAVGRYLRSHTRTSYVTMDLSAPKVTVNYDIAQTPFRNNEFDLIYCSHVLEHVPHDRAAMQELFRILAPGGVLIVMVPIGIGPTDEDPEKGATPELRLRHFGQSDHVRRYGLDIVDRLHQASFETRVAATSSSAYAPYIRNCGFLREDFVFSAEKKSEKTRRGGL